MVWRNYVTVTLCIHNSNVFSRRCPGSVEWNHTAARCVRGRCSVVASRCWTDAPSRCRRCHLQLREPTVAPPGGRKHVLWPCRRRNWRRLLSDAAQMARSNWSKLPSVGLPDRRSMLLVAVVVVLVLLVMCYAGPDDGWSHAERGRETANAVGSAVGW